MLLFVVGFFSTNVFAQTASDLKFYQDGKTIVLTYSLDKTANVSVQVSTDGGVTYSEPLKHVSGDVGENVHAGNNRIVWDVLAEYEKLIGEKVMFKLTAGSSKCSFIVNGVTFTMIYVQGGTFTMGATHEQTNTDSDEYPVHQVTLSDYYIGAEEVSQALWQAVMGNNPSFFKHSAKPVETVSWHDCQEFIRKLNALTGKTFRLPTEAEWEYAARGGNKSKGYKYSGSNNIDDVAWYSGNVSALPLNSQETQVGSTKNANELGIYDMSGNVSEWCADWYGSYSNSAQLNPSGASSGYSCVVRGGWRHSTSSECRISARSSNRTGDSDITTGLRLVLVL